MKFRRPMAAKNFEGNEHRVEYPCFAQPKLDGVRCVTDGRRFWSKNGKLFPRVNTQHLESFLQQNHLVDGELMIPGALFEETISAVKHASNNDRSAAERLKFCVFDTLTPDAFVERTDECKIIVTHAKAFGAAWRRVQTTLIRDERHLQAFSKEMVSRGHEGIMVRNASGLYVSGRSYDLLKLKPLLDAEYPVVGVIQAKGKDKGTPIFFCRAGIKTFRVRPKGTMKQRRAMWEDRMDLIGKKLTVEYQNLTKYGVPRFPRAKVFRDYE